MDQTFLQDAGLTAGVFTSNVDYDGLNKQDHFWAFWDNQYAYKDIYSGDGNDGASIRKLSELGERSIEHIIPKSKLSKLLKVCEIRIPVRSLNFIPI